MILQSKLIYTRLSPSSNFSFQKLKRVIASVFRFFDNLKQNILTHFQPMLHLRINQVVDFY